jgi:hypothetical protein
MRSIHLRLTILSFVSIICFSCSNSGHKDQIDYPTKDYLEVARLFRDSIKSFPQVIDISNKQKRLIFIGTAHTTQITHQADSIANIFNRLKPQIAFNEGGIVSASTKFESQEEGITKMAETGQLKFLCDQAGIPMVNGDLEDSTEWAELFKMHSRRDVLLYMCNERFLDLYAKGWIDTIPGIQKCYQKEFIDYYTARKVEFKEEEQQFSFIEKAYRDYLGTTLDVHKIPGDKFYFLSDGGRLCKLGRDSKEVRDRALLKKLAEAFKTNDRVLVIFGGAHAIAMEPALHQLMDHIYE